MEEQIREKQTAPNSVAALVLGIASIVFWMCNRWIGLWNYWFDLCKQGFERIQQKSTIV